jgi:hypothetical protein
MIEVSSAASLDSIAAVIYCVVPEPLADELYDKLASYYEDDPNVTVIVDRRRGSRREPGSSGGGQRELRDRRRHRVAGEFPRIAGNES